MLSTRRVAFAFQSPLFTSRLSRMAPFTTSRPFVMMMTAIDEDEAVETTVKGVDSTWNVGGLKKEVARLVMRSHKKLGKANTKLTQAQKIMEKLTGDPDATFEQLEKCPNVGAIELELEELRDRHQKLNQLEDLLQSEKNRSGTLPEDVVGLTMILGVSDEPAPKQERGPPKQKGPRETTGGRLPYRKYFALDKTQIRVSFYVACLCTAVTISDDASSNCINTYLRRSERRQKITMNSLVHQNIEMEPIGGCTQPDVRAVI